MKIEIFADADSVAWQAATLIAAGLQLPSRNAIASSSRSVA